MVGRASPYPNCLNIDRGMRLILAPRSHKAFSKMEFPIVHGIVKLPGFIAGWQFSLQDGTTLLSEVHYVKIRKSSFVGQNLFHEFHIVGHLL